MRIPRLCIAGSYLAGEVLTLSAEQTHHLTRVLRRGPGDDIIVFNGAGQSFAARIFAVQRGGADIEVIAAADDEAAPATPIHLALAVLKSDTLDYVLQKVTELGVSAIQLVDSARAEARHTDPLRRARRVAHWQAILIGAAEQCGRNWLPTLAPPQPFAHWLQASSGQRWLLDRTGQNVRSTPLRIGEPLTIAIGPEGGWTDDERVASEQHGLATVSLGPRVLRADTAPVVALTLAQHLAGEL